MWEQQLQALQQPWCPDAFNTLIGSTLEKCMQLLMLLIWNEMCCMQHAADMRGSTSGKGIDTVMALVVHGAHVLSMGHDIDASEVHYEAGPQA